MEAEEIVLEEGEVSAGDDDDSLSNYTPLERPSNYSVVQPYTRFPVRIQDSESEEELESTDTDSDSDNVTKVKRAKIKIKPKPIPKTTKNKKYDIWATKIREEVLSANLDSCDVTTKDKSRNVESYDYTLARKYYEELEHRGTSKRSRDDRRNDFIFRNRKRSPSKEKVKGNSRLILDLTVTSSNSAEDIAKDIANKLCEEKEDLIIKVINAMGKEKSIEFFNETKRIEDEGGMLIMNQTRRRTPGGVYLYLVRNDYHITPEQKEKIFNEDRQKHKKMVKEKQRLKSNKIKCDIATAKAKLLPELLTRGELLVQDYSRERKDQSDANVINPPPTPETDCHENENSGDGMDPIVPKSDPMEDTRGKLQTYDDDFLDLNCGDIDMF